MDSQSVKKRKRRGKRSRKVPPIFNREYPPFVPQDSLPQDIFPINIARPPTKPLDSQEIFNRFSQLLDWRLPPADNIPSYTEQNRNLRDNTDRYNSSIDEDLVADRGSNLGKRKITDPNDLRNRLDQQYKRFKYTDDNYQGSRRGDSSFMGGGDYNERSGMSVGNLNVSNDSWGSNYRGDDQRYRNDRQIEVPMERTIRERDSDDRLARMDGYDEVPARSSGKPCDNFPNSFPDRMVINESTTWPNDRVYTSEERWAVNVEDDISRKDKEHRPVIEEIPHNIPDDNLRTNMNEEKYEHERETSRHVERYDTFNNDNWNQFRNDYDTERYHYNRNAYDNRDDGRLRKDREAYSAGDRDRIRYDEAIHYMRQKYFPGDIRDAPKRMPQSSGGYNHPNDMPSCSRNDGPIISSYDDNISRNHPSDDDLTVIIYKQDESKITFQDADTLRSMLIDLVVNCGNPDQMPEFKRSGIMRSNKGFYVLCRTQETLDWLLKQSLPKLNDVQLLIRRNRTMEIIKVSAFAPKCTRTREEVFKLLKLQNGKKGFNFNNWTMRGYQLSPKGVYMSFDISTDQLRLLQEMHCELSFELKALTFKISRNTVHVVSDFNR